MVPQVASAAPSAAAGCPTRLASCIGSVVARSAREVPAACPPAGLSANCCHATVAEPEICCMPLDELSEFVITASGALLCCM